MSSANGKKSLALLAAGMVGSMAVSANAASYLTVNVLGRIQGGDPTYVNTLQVSPGQVVEYKLQFQLAPEGSANANPSTAANKTIPNWKPSPTNGLGSVRFSLGQAATPGTVQASFNDAVPGDDTDPLVLPAERKVVVFDDPVWDDGTGWSGGTLVARGNGNNDVSNVTLIRATNNFAGVGGTDGAETYPLFPAVSGNMTITAADPGTQGVVNGFIDSSGTLAGGFRWTSGTGTTTNATISVSNHNTSIANGDPIIKFNGLTLTTVPEPTSLGLLGLAGLGALARRRRQA